MLVGSVTRTCETTDLDSVIEKLHKEAYEKIKSELLSDHQVKFQTIINTIPYVYSEYAHYSSKTPMTYTKNTTNVTVVCTAI